MSFLHTLLVASLAAFVAGQCPTDFFDAGGRCYTVYDAPGTNMTWEECRAFCQAEMVDDADWDSDIATFDNAEQLEDLSIAWLDISQTLPEYPYMWIGVHKMDGEWVDINDKKIRLQNAMWNVGHPHDMGINTFLEDVDLTTEENSHGRLYMSCTMGMYEYHSRCLCLAKKPSL